MKCPCGEDVEADCYEPGDHDKDCVTLLAWEGGFRDGEASHTLPVGWMSPRSAEPSGTDTRGGG